MFSYKIFTNVKVTNAVFSHQDVERLYPQERNMVKVTLVEANQILSSFDTKLRNYAERKIKQRAQMNLLSGSVVGMQRYHKHLLSILSRESTNMPHTRLYFNFLFSSILY